MLEHVEKRPLFFACTLATFACLICSYLDVVGMITVGAVVLFVFLFVIPFKTKLRVCSVLTLILCLAVIASSIFRYVCCYKPAEKYSGVDAATIKGEVIESDADSVIVRCDVVSVNGEVSNNSFRAVFYYDEASSLCPSSVISADVRFYDDLHRCADKGAVIYGVISDNVEIERSFNQASVRYIIYKTRMTLMNNLPFKDPQVAAFVKGMIFGYESDISGVFLNMFDTVGMSHVMTVSGLHLVFSVVLVDLVLALFSIDNRIRAVIAVFAIVMFTFLSGFAVACIRAAIMMSIYYVGRAVGKIPDGLTSLAFAGFLILVIAPYNIRSLSFVLSMTATLGIIVLMPCFNDLIKIRFKNTVLRGIYKTVTSLFTLSLSATLACLPVIAITFEQVCIISPIVNVLLTFPLQMLFYVGAFAVILSFIPFLDPIFSFLGDTLYAVIDFVVTKCYFMKNITVSGGYRYFYLVLALLAVLIIGIYVLYRKNIISRFALSYVSGYIVLCLVMFFTNLISSIGKVDVTFADVGQGSCTVISQNESAVIVDCGGSDMSGLNDTLNDKSVKKLELIAITHMDSDHVCFLEQILDKYIVDNIIYPEFTDVTKYKKLLEKAESNGTKVTAIKADTDFDVLQDSLLRCFVEKAAPVKYTNNLSAVYKLETGDNSVLFTGDMNIYQEYQYLEYGNDLDVDILLVAHHGSKTSSHQRFLELCTPDYSIISVGIDNPSGHPDKDIVKRLKAISKVIQTSERASVTFILKQKGYYLYER